MLILIAGLPGSGKTTIARAFAQKYGAAHFNTDHIRRELGLWGSYRPEDKARVYEEVLTQARLALARGETVVVDSTFFKKELRKSFVQLAENQGVKVFWVLATAPEKTLHQRVAAPRPDSEADEGVLEKIKAEFEPLEPPFLTIDTASAVPDAAAAAIYKYAHNG